MPARKKTKKKVDMSCALYRAKLPINMGGAENSMEFGIGIVSEKVKGIGKQGIWG
jgi:hypothetical protein